MSRAKVSKFESNIRKKSAKMKLRKRTTMHTGAHHNVMPRRMAGKRAFTQPFGSKRGMHYVAARNECIPNDGEILFDFESLEGHKESLNI